MAWLTMRRFIGLFKGKPTPERKPPKIHRVPPQGSPELLADEQMDCPLGKWKPGIGESKHAVP